MQEIRSYLRALFQNENFNESERALSKIIGSERVIDIIEKGGGFFYIGNWFKHRKFIERAVERWLREGREIKVKEWCKVIGCKQTSFYNLLHSIYRKL